MRPEDVHAYGTISLPELCIGSLCYLQISWEGGSSADGTDWYIQNKPLLVKVGDGTTYPILKLIHISGGSTLVYATVTASSSNLNFHLYVYKNTVRRLPMFVKYIYFR